MRGLLKIFQFSASRNKENERQELEKKLLEKENNLQELQKNLLKANHELRRFQVMFNAFLSELLYLGKKHVD